MPFESKHNTMPSTYTTAKCHCGMNVFRITFDTTYLPQPVGMCHCDTCRHSTGEMATIYVPIQGEPLKRSSPRYLAKDTNQGDIPADLGHLKEYKTSDGTARYFCKLCSAHILIKRRSQWAVAIGCMDQASDFIELKWHTFVADTKDGGMTAHLGALAENGVELYKKEFGGERVTLELKDRPGKGEGGEMLPLHCHCRTISLLLTRPTELSFEPHLPIPDVLISKASPGSLSKIRNRNDEKWWLRPAGAQKPNKYLAGYCAEQNCRLTTGAEVFGWMYVPRVNVLDACTMKEIGLADGEHRPQGMKQYICSPGLNRESCEKCGATIMWWDSTRPELLDVAAGLVDQAHSGGARAEEWLEWHTKRIGYTEKALERDLVRAIEDV